MRIHLKKSVAPRSVKAGERLPWRSWVCLLLLLMLTGCNLPMEPRPEPTAILIMPTGKIMPTATQPSALATPETMQAPPRPTIVTPSATPTRPATQVKPTTAPTLAPTVAYPAQPEAVVTAFLAAYPDAPEEMRRFLSAELRRNLDAAGTLRLVQFTGQLMGFAVQSGSQSNNPPRAMLLVALSVDGAEIQREFTLLREDNRWVIDAIESK